MDIQLRFAGHTYSWSFRLAQVTQPLLGADFLTHHHLLLDVAGQRLLVTDCYSTTPLQLISPCVQSAAPQFGHSSPSTPMCSSRSFISNVIPLISITTSGAPVYSRFLCLNPEKLLTVRTPMQIYVSEMLSYIVFLSANLCNLIIRSSGILHGIQTNTHILLNEFILKIAIMI